jgi:Uma2 family endonuclease
MTTVTVMPREGDFWMPRDHEWTVDDLEDLPDDGLQYELFDGVLVVSAAPNIPHQRAVLACASLLRVACPPELEVFVAPVDFQPTQRRSLQPDVLVARRDALGIKNITVAPALVVEVLSASTRSKDLIFKREMYQSSGVDAYWVIDPDAVSFAAYERADGAYRLIASAQGEERVTLSHPYAVTVCPADIVAGR